MSDSLDQLEADAKARKRTGRTPGGSRNPRRKPPTSVEGRDAQAKAAAELAAREAEAQRRRAEREAEAGAADRQAEPELEAPKQPSTGAKRPTSTPFYPNPEDEDFLWQIQEAATARREKVPATAVLRFALRRLSEQMTPSEVVRALGGPVQTQGKKGRPRR